MFRGKPAITRLTSFSRMTLAILAMAAASSALLTIVRGVARIPRGSERARPMRLSPTSSARIRAMSTSVLNQIPDKTQGFIKLRFVFAAGLGEVGLATAPAAGDLRNLSNNVTGVITLSDEVRGNGCHEHGTLAADSAEDDNNAGELITEEIGHFPQDGGVIRGHAGDEEFNAFDLFYLF